jgi:hypothetical protein
MTNSKSDTRRETLIDTLEWIRAGHAITVCKPQTKRVKNRAGFSQGKTKAKRTTGFEPNQVKTNWFFQAKPE